jgi:hypothetical protein
MLLAAQCLLAASVTGLCSSSVLLVYGRRSSFDRGVGEADCARENSGTRMKPAIVLRTDVPVRIHELKRPGSERLVESRESPKGAVWPKASLTGAVPFGRWCA